MSYSEIYRNRLVWFMQNESLWSDTDALKTKAIADGIYSAKLSNIVHCLEAMIGQCRTIKRRTPSPSQPFEKRTELIITEENFDELIQMREVIDILTSIKHPFRKMDDSGFTYYDYAVFKRREKGVQQHILDDINIIFNGGDIDFYC